jgi:hypothetical protein
VLLSLTFFNGYVTLPELLWAVIPLYGLHRTHKNLVYARLRNRLASRMRSTKYNGDTLTLTNMYVRVHAALMFYCIVNCSVGVGAMLLPPATPAVKVTPTAILITVGLFLGQLLVIAVSELVYRTDKMLAEGDGPTSVTPAEH